MAIRNLRINKRIMSIVLGLGFALNSFPSLGKSDGDGTKLKNNIYYFEEVDESYYRRYNTENKEFQYISIFDDENIFTSQYGASQVDFKDKTKELIENKLIWNELQKYFPVNDFKSTDEAKIFYEAYFSIIGYSGCGYAVAANYIFQNYEGREKEFEKALGYPMYEINKDGDIDFNYEVFMLKFFNYYNLDRCNKKREIIDSLENEINRKRIEFRLRQLDDYNILPKDFKTWTREEQLCWIELGYAKEKEYAKLSSELKKIKSNNINLGIQQDDSFGYLKDYLNRFGIDCNIKYSKNITDYNVGDIIASENFDLYQMNPYGIIVSKNSNIGLHYLYITDTGNESVIVSSWGNKYVLDNSNATNVSKVLIKNR